VLWCAAFPPQQLSIAHGQHARLQRVETFAIDVAQPKASTYTSAISDDTSVSGAANKDSAPAKAGSTPWSWLSVAFVLGVISTFVGKKIGDEVWAGAKRWFVRKVREPKRRKQFAIAFEKERRLPEAILSIDRALPRYEAENLKIRLTDGDLLLPIPETWRARLEQLGFEGRAASMFGVGDDIQELERIAGIPRLTGIINTQAERIAEQIWDELNRGNARFNGPMLAPRKVRGNRTTVGEKPVLALDLYRTDYFTYQVLESTYKALRAGKEEFGFKSNFESINAYPMFTTSFGVAFFLIVDDGHGDSVFLCRRSSSLSVDAGKWHFSMNEAFSPKDIDNSSLADAPSLETCLFRGLDEELKLARNNLVSDSWCFTDLVMNVDRCGIGVLGHARLKISDKYTVADFLSERRSAQDVTLETDAYQFVRMDEISTFVDRNRRKISDACVWGLLNLELRYRTGHVERSA
jgi:hypothetical protein